MCIEFMILDGTLFKEYDAGPNQCHLKAPSTGADDAAREKVCRRGQEPLKRLLACTLSISDRFRRRKGGSCGGKKQYSSALIE
jgi:hypothetical protein